MTFLLQGGQAFLQRHFADMPDAGVRDDRGETEQRFRVRPGPDRREFPDRFRRPLGTKRAAQQLSVR
ncbi:hypothetical protein B1T47_05440, partial [Mycobacterium kansasii]|uniref:hypothetical protein n=1 Tax=Mycobacterium kansasii TaxID=1768 RepID=UPI0009EF748A